MSLIDRRQFAAGVLASSVTGPAQSAQGMPEHFLLEPNGWMPNNPRLPVLLYRDAYPQLNREATAAAMERDFAANGWPPQWRNGIYSFHHFHSTAHEILGIAAGEVRVTLGGPKPGGRDLILRAGDVAALPAGTGHCNLGASADLLVIGAYPDGQHWDICREAPSTAALERMRDVSFPASDPIRGRPGPLPTLWRA